MADTPEQKRPHAPASAEKPVHLTDEDVARLADEGLRLRRALEERVTRKSHADSTEIRIRFR